MTHYTRTWDCLACGERCESIDYPRVLVCDRCISRDPWVSYFRTQRDAAARMAAKAESDYLDKYRAVAVSERPANTATGDH